MSNKRTRIGIILVALAILTALIVPANAATIRFVPDPSSAATDGTVWVKMYVDLPPGETLLSWQAQILIDPDHADVIAVSKNCDPNADDTCFNTVGKNLTYTCNGHVWSYAAQPREWVYDDTEGEYMWKCPPLGYFTGPRTIKLCRYRVLANGTPGVSPFEFGDEYHPSDCPICMESGLFNSTSLRHDNETWMDSTFTHIGALQTFEKELVLGWNLISPPLEPEDDNSTSAVLSSMSGNYSAVFRYDSTAKEFEVVTDGTMFPGIGYFVNVTTAGTWSYTGRYTSISVDLKPGLNCIGWGNTSEDISGALSPISGNYSYVARWDADDPKYEVYDANSPPEFIDFETMERGNGYWIAAKKGYTLDV